MKVLTFAHQKGGVGKSTLAINVAHALRKQGYTVAVKDFDLQGTSFKILNSLDNIDIYGPKGEIKNDYDFLIIDTPPYLNPVLIDIFAESDVVIIPTKPSIPDIIAINGTIELYDKASIRNRNLKGKIVINQLVSSSSILGQLRGELDSLSLKIFDTKIENRVAYGRSLIEENGIFSDEDKKAQTEMTAFTNEILNLV